MEIRGAELLKDDVGLPDLYRAAQCWEWLGVTPRTTPVAATHVGDLLLERDGAVLLLDLMAGTLEPVWPSRTAMDAGLEDRDAQRRHLRLDEVRAFVAAGLVADPGEVLAPDVPTALGGTLQPEALRSRGVLQLHRMMSSLHRQLHDMQPGERTTGVTIDHARGEARLHTTTGDTGHARIERATALLRPPPDAAVVARSVVGLWGWVGVGADATLLGTSPFGDLFVEDAQGPAYLDVVLGRLLRPWDSNGAMLDDVATSHGEERWGRRSAVLAARDAGMVAGPDRMLVPQLLPVLGGALDLHPTVVLLLAGHTFAAQVHVQVRSLPPGSRLVRVDTDGHGRIRLVVERP